MKSTLVKIAVAMVLVFSLFIVTFAISYPQILGYRLFLMRDKAYYSDVGRACDVLIKSTTGKPIELRGAGLSSIPPVLLKLNPDHVVVQTNLVMVRIGGGVICYSLVWGPGEDDSSQWHLSITGPDRHSCRTVFSQSKRQ